MIDIITVEDGLDLGVYDTQTQKAKNILSTQLRSLEYAKDFGIDLEFFLIETFRFENESFKAYCIQVLANFGINVSTVVETIENLFSEYFFNLTPEETSTGLIAR